MKTREEWGKVLPIIQAFVEGKKLEVKTINGWVEHPIDEYLTENMLENFCYRVKKE